MHIKKISIEFGSNHDVDDDNDNEQEKQYSRRYSRRYKSVTRTR